jgi:hypothetical protein
VDVHGWFLAGRTPAKYQATTDASVSCSGTSSVSLRSTSPATSATDFGTVMTDDSATRAVPADLLGKRVRLSGYVKADSVSGWAGLWMRVDGAQHGTVAPTLAFDNMQKRPIVGSTGWARYEVVLDVAPNAKNLALGILLSEGGQVWLDGVNLEVVDPSVPTTAP